MLRIENISKIYSAGTQTVHALDNVSVSFRKNEFVSILGPSGSGKTTLLNIIGGLDKYSEGDLFIVGKSTKDFSDRDWDIYRNQRIGFIFQSYNLIPHQTILGNVELALTISGVNSEERKVRALKALEEVGLKGQEHKKPNQLSGGQCQRVAIARALVNNPEILLADEPTGALDTKTSEQIMKLIQKIASDRLVIMVTHNPDIAERYSTRILNLLDGKIVSDSKPYSTKEEQNEVASLDDSTINKHSKAKMSWGKAISLSWKNLISKFKRTLLVAIAGSIGIIGVSTVLAVSNGISSYIESMQDDMLSAYPLGIAEESVDYSALMTGLSNTEKAESVKVEEGKIGVDSMIEYLMEKYQDFTSVKTNDINYDLLEFINEMPSEGYAAISYNYGIDITNNIFTTFRAKDAINEEFISLNGLTQMYISELQSVDGFKEYAQFVSLFTSFMKQIPGDQKYIIGNGEGDGQYDLVAGSYGESENDLMLVLDNNSTLTDVLLAQLGLFSEDEFIDLAITSIEKNKENPDPSKLTSDSFDKRFDYSTILNKQFIYYPHDTIYSYQKVTEATMTLPSGGTFKYDVNGYCYPAVRDPSWGEGIPLKISGILRPNKNTSFGCLTRGIYYSKALTEKYLSDAKGSEILTNQEHGFYSHIKSSAESSSPFLAYVTYSYNSWDDGNATPHDDGYAICLNADLAESFAQMFSGTSGKVDYFEVDKIYLRALAGQSIKQSVSKDSQAIISKSVEEGGSTTYFNIDQLPQSISIYPTSFNAKDIATSYLDKWNSSETITLNSGKVLLKENREELTYTDTIELIIDMINTLINIVTTALISFTSLSLVVSCFMIAVITYISVVERVKEIGVIRSLGGRKKDVRNLFVAETFIIGFSSGVIGVGVTYLLCLLLNFIVSFYNVPAIGLLSLKAAVIMVVLSFVLTVLSGLIPSGNASKQNPVDALRSE